MSVTRTPEFICEDPGQIDVLGCSAAGKVQKQERRRGARRLGHQSGGLGCALSLTHLAVEKSRAFHKDGWCSQCHSISPVDVVVAPFSHHTTTSPVASPMGDLKPHKVTHPAGLPLFLLLRRATGQPDEDILFVSSVTAIFRRERSRYISRIRPCALLT